MIFTEDTRVKIPAILHLVRLGYTYLSIKDVKKEDDSNIFTEVFINSICSINSGLSTAEAQRLLD